MPLFMGIGPSRARTKRQAYSGLSQSIRILFVGLAFFSCITWPTQTLPNKLRPPAKLWSAVPNHGGLPHFLPRPAGGAYGASRRQPRPPRRRAPRPHLRLRGHISASARPLHGLVLLQVRPTPTRHSPFYLSSNLLV